MLNLHITDTLEITLQCPAELAGYLSEQLWGLEGVQSVLETVKDEVVQQVKVYLQHPEVVEKIQALLQTDTLLSPETCRIIEQRIIKEEDWAESWKQYWHVQQITDRVTICPSWEPYTPQHPEEIVLHLDPGCAFGTGTHETTRLMLQGIEALAHEKPLSQLSILDVGTGSGVLALYAAKLGCQSILAIDNDPAAVQATLENIDRNGVSSQVSATDTPLAELCRTPYDVILANIIAPVILELLPELCLRLNKGGTLLASGLIESTVGTVQDAMAQAGFTNFKRDQQGDWYALRGDYQP